MSISWRRSLVSMAALGLLVSAGCDTGKKSDIRLLNVSQGYSSLDLYSDSSEEVASLATQNISAYKTPSSGSHTIAITAAGVSRTNALKSVVESLSDGKHKTYVAYGDSGQFGTLEISEDQSAPSSSYASVEVLNTAVNAGSVDVYLTSSTVALSDVSPTFTAVAGATTAAFTTITSGTFRLRVTATGSKSDLRLDVPSITLASGSVTSIIVADTVGGFLVDAAILPQQGTLTYETNPSARVRAVSGISTGSNVVVTLGGVGLLSAAPANSIGTYQLVPVGSEAVTLNVGGTAVSVANQTLTEGGDYTLLIYTSSGATATALLTDNNHLPTSGYANVRLVNAMSGLADPISLAVDYSPIASDITLGTASAYTNVTASTTAELDVTDATTSASLFSQASTTLTTEEVYTLFMFGSASAPTGTLRTDR